MIVTTRTTHGQSQKPAADHIDAIVPLVRARDLDGAVVVKPGTLSEKPKRRKHPHPRFLLHLIPRQLRAHKLVIGQIIIKSFYDPIAIQVRMRIGREPATHWIKAAIVVFAIARNVEPQASPSFSVLRRGEQAIYYLCESIRRFVVLECLNLFRRRRYAGQIKCRASQQRAPIRGSDGRKPFFLQASKNEAIDFIFGPAGVFD